MGPKWLSQTSAHTTKGKQCHCGAIKGCPSLWILGPAEKPTHNWITEDKQTHDTTTKNTHILIHKPEILVLSFSLSHTQTHHHNYNPCSQPHTSKCVTHITPIYTYAQVTLPGRLLLHSSLSGVLPAGCPSGSFPSSCFSCGRQA